MTNSIIRDLQTMMSARVFFGHQSVGQNIIDGIIDLLHQHGLDDSFILADEQPPSSGNGFLWHRPVGRNTQPVSKCEDFIRILDQQTATRLEYALFKFCYIDVNEQTDVGALFDHYQNTLNRLRTACPHIHFIHCTLPLRHNATGTGVLLREMLGRPNRSKLANIKRNQFNRMLVDHYGRSHLIDLAASESTLADGRRVQFSYRGEHGYYSLAGAYTNDGGHLNQTGRNKVASDFIRDLARIIRDQQHQSDYND